MAKSDFKILSTRPLDAALIAQAAAQNIQIDTVSFIETESIKTDAVANKVRSVAQQNSVVIFTSMNAVEAIEPYTFSKPFWKIYCIGNTTCQLAEEVFGDDSIAGTAENASNLADVMIADGVKEVTFFCGNMRRDELPDKLKNAGIAVDEVVVYKTNETAHSIPSIYNGILFFSPSAVRSFFAANQEDKDTKYFAIGTTTADALQQYTNGNIIVAERATKDELAKQAISYFSKQKI